MKLSIPLRLSCATVLVFGAHAANAIVVSDPIGDYVIGFAGSKKGDLDAVGSFVTYNPATDTFLFGGIMDANIGTSTNGTSPSGLYV